MKLTIIPPKPSLGDVVLRIGPQNDKERSHSESNRRGNDDQALAVIRIDKIGKYLRGRRRETSEMRQCIFIRVRPRFRSGRGRHGTWHLFCKYCCSREVAPQGQHSLPNKSIYQTGKGDRALIMSNLAVSQQHRVANRGSEATRVMRRIGEKSVNFRGHCERRRTVKNQQNPTSARIQVGVYIQHFKPTSETCIELLKTDAIFGGWLSGSRFAALFTSIRPVATISRCFSAYSSSGLRLSCG